MVSRIGGHTVLTRIIEITGRLLSYFPGEIVMVSRTGGHTVLTRMIEITGRLLSYFPGEFVMVSRIGGHTVFVRALFKLQAAFYPTSQANSSWLVE